MNPMHSDLARANATRYIVNAEFNQATVHFSDGSSLQFEHIGRASRWAKASADGTTADQVCRSLRQFRLNAKHLQLFFEDGSDIEFFAYPPLS